MPQNPPADSPDQRDSSPPQRSVVVYIGYESMCDGARRIFGKRVAETGHFHPRKLAESLCQLYNDRFSGEYPVNLARVCVYRGRPKKKDGARHLHFQEWRKTWEDDLCRLQQGAQLAYRGPETANPDEKEIDTGMAVDLVAHANRGLYDVGIVCTREQELAPALQRVTERYGAQFDLKIGVWGFLKDNAHLHIPRERLVPIYLSAPEQYREAGGH